MLTRWTRIAVAVALVSGAVLALTAPGFTATEKARVPIASYDLDPATGSPIPAAGKTVGYVLVFSTSKTLTMSVEYVRPAAAVKVTAHPTPTRWDHGNPVWKHKICSCALHRYRLKLTFSPDMRANEKLVHKIIFRAAGYRPVIETLSQLAAG